MNKSLGSVLACAVLVVSSCSSSPDSADSGPADSTTTTTTTDVVVLTDAPTTTTTTTTTVSPDSPDCTNPDWTMVDTGPFTFLVPADVIDQRAQGIDSLVGQFSGGGIELAFDYGWFSPGLDDVERLGATIMQVSLGAFEGAFGTADSAAGEYGSDFITHLAVEAGPYPTSNALWMGVSYDDDALIETAECIVSTVRFAGEAGPTDEETASGVTIVPAAAVGQPQGELLDGAVRLWVSNQSFEDDPVVVSVTIDGDALLEETLFVEGQHNWMAFDILGLAPGEHSLTSVSSTGALHADTFTLPEGSRRWLVLDYWYYPEDVEGRFFSFSESDSAVAFA